MKRVLVGLSVLLLLGVNGAALAGVPIPSDDRDASFMPPPQAVQGSDSATGVGDTVKLDSLTKKKAGEATSSSSQTPVSLTEPPPFTPPPTVASPAQPIAITPAATPTASPSVTASVSTGGVDLGDPVSSKPLGTVDPENMGLLSPSNGGLGSSMWKDTPRAMIDRLLPAVSLPTASPALNDLARRLLASTAALPVPDVTVIEGPQRSFTSIRVEKLLALGDTVDAWKLAMLAEPGRVDEITLRMLVEAALISPVGNEACAKIPSLMAAHNKADEAGLDWQKSLIICKLKDKDQNAVQLGADLLREQKAKDDIFMTLLNRNLLAGNKQLPRQMTPLRATSLALLRNVDLPLPPELYSRPDAALIPELLAAKAADEKVKLGLAERAAASGLLTASQLGDVYKSVSFSPEEIANANDSSEASPRTRAMAYQALLNEQAPLKKIGLIHRLVDTVEGSGLTGSLGRLAAEVLSSVAPATEFGPNSAQMARLYALAGAPDKAMAWLKIAQGIGDRIPDVGAQMTQAWPLFVLSGLIGDGEFSKGLKGWLDAALAAKEGSGDRERRTHAGNVLLILAAAGYAVPEDAWARVIDADAPTRQVAASPLLVERLRQAGVAGRKGETAMLSLLVSGSGAADTPVGAWAETIRALRLAGLTGEAQALAREALAAMGL